MRGEIMSGPWDLWAFSRTRVKAALPTFKHDFGEKNKKSKKYSCQYKKVVLLFADAYNELYEI